MNMENTLQNIEQIMQRYYDKKRENEELFSMPSREKVRLENEIKRLSIERNKQVFDLKEQLEYLRDNKDREINNYINNSFANSDNLINLDDYALKYMNRTIPDVQRYLPFDDLDKTEMINRAYQDYKDEEQDLIKKIDKISEAEKELKDVMSQLRILRLNKEKLKKKYVSQNVVGDDPVTTSAVVVNFENKYASEENKLISKIVELSNIEVKDTIKQKNAIVTISDKEELENRLRKVQSILQKELKEPSVKPIGYRKTNFTLENVYIEREQKLISEIEALSVDSEDEVRLKQELDLLIKQPNYDKVYIREMFDLKFELRRQLNDEKIKIETILKPIQDELNEITNIINAVQKEKQNRINVKLAEVEMIKVQLSGKSDKKDGLVKNSENDFHNLDKEKKLANDYLKLVSELEIIEKESVLTPEQDARWQVLNAKISELMGIIQQIKMNYDVLEPTAEETAIYTGKMEPYEQEEYDRRRTLKKIDTNKVLQINPQISEFITIAENLDRANIQISPIIGSAIPEDSNETAQLVEEDQLNIDISDEIPVDRQSDSESLNPEPVKDLTVDGKKESEQPTAEIPVIEEQPNSEDLNPEPVEDLTVDAEKESEQPTAEIPVIEEQSNPESLNPEPVKDLTVDAEKESGQPTAEEKTSSNAELFYNDFQEIPEDLINKYEPLDFDLFNDKKIESIDRTRLLNSLYMDIISRIDNLKSIKLDSSKSNNPESKGLKLGEKAYIGTRTRAEQDSKFDLNGGFVFDNPKAPLSFELLYGEYINYDDICSAIEEYRDKTKGKEYIVLEQNKTYTISESRIKKLEKALKDCSIIVLESKDSKMKVSGTDSNDRKQRAYSIGDIDTVLPSGNYINREELIEVLGDLLKPKRLDWLKGMSSEVQGINDDINSEYGDEEGPKYRR